jgi:hypothetical protein
MADAPAHLYAKFPLHMGHNKTMDLANGADVLKMMLLSAYTVGTTESTAEILTDITTSAGTEHSSTSTGYTAGGKTLVNQQWATTAANSWANTWQAAHAYAKGAIIRPVTGNGYLYQCVSGGTSHATTEPTWATNVGREQPSDNGVIWLNIGVAVTTLTADQMVWTAGANPIVAVAGVLYDDTAASDPLISWIDLGIGTGGMTASGDGVGTLTVDCPASGFAAFPAS